MQVKCIEGHWHNITQGGMLAIIDAFLTGDLQTVGKNSIESQCILTAFTQDRVDALKRRYPATGRKTVEKVIPSAETAPN